MGVAESDAVRVMIEILGRIDDEVEGAIETLEILGDETTLKSIEEGLKDIKAGDVITFEDFLESTDIDESCILSSFLGDLTAIFLGLLKRCGIE